MPIPHPHKGESKKTFISRCMGDSVMNKEYDDQSQRAAVCYQKWKDKKAKAAYIIEAGDDEYIIAKEPIDSDINKREKNAGDPPKDEMPNPEKGGPSSCPNPDRSTAPSSNHPQRGSKNGEKKSKGVDSMDDKSAKPNLDDMAWYMGKYDLEPQKDEQTGLAKWPLSFKRIEKDTKRPNKPTNPTAAKPKPANQEQPPTAV